MAFQFKLNVDDDEDKFLQQINRASMLNLRSQNQDSIMRRAKSSMIQIPKLVGIATEYPQMNNQFQIPRLQNVFQHQDKVNVFTPAPPIIRNKQEKAIWRMVKKFSNKYTHLWILICQPKHQAITTFADLYKDDQNNINQHFQNLLTSEDYYKARIFTKQGLQVKVMLDYITFERYLVDEIRQFEKDEKVLSIFVQNSKKTGRGILPTKKIKNVPSLTQFIDSQMKEDLERSKKDIPYFNFIHSNSGPELFNRRSIIKNCLCMKSQKQMTENHFNFVRFLQKQTNQNRQNAIKDITNKNKGNLIAKTNQKFDKFQKINAAFSFTFSEYIKKYYPLQQFSQIQKRQVYNWVISQYCVQSTIYPMINNIMRYSLNMQKINPISTFVKYLFDALRFYFTTRYRQITFKKLYRGARISNIQQRSFVEGRYLWNLGFTSTSRSKKVAQSFIANMKSDDTQKVLVVIELSPLTNELQYLWDQQGFYSLDKIPQIRQSILVDEEQVLFNPLNVFQIVGWDKDRKVLELLYAPQLEIIQKKRQGVPLTQQQLKLLRSIAKLKDSGFDKGQQLLQEGDPSSAIKYYEQSDQTGSQLSFTQKANYIKGLMQIGSLQKMQSLLKQSIQQQKNAQKQLMQTGISDSSTSISKLADSVQSLTLYQQNTDFQKANQKAEDAKNLTMQKSIQKLSQQTLLLQTKAYIQLAKIKYGVSQTLDSIRQSIRSLKIIDHLAEVNLCFRLHRIGNQLRQIKQLKVNQDMENIKFILGQKKYLNLNIQSFKQQIFKKIGAIRFQKLDQENDNQDLNSSKDKQPINKRQFDMSSSSKYAHLKAQQLLHNYFKKRDIRSQVQNLQQKFVFAYWEVQRAKIQKKGISQKQQIEQRQQLKICRQNLFDVKNDYKDLFQHQIEAYQVLYRNIYKTSIDVSSCLKSYHKNLFQRYQNFINVERKYEGDSADVARVYWRHGEILFQYGQIIQRPLLGDLNQITVSEKLGSEKIKQAEVVIKSIQQRQSNISGRKKQYTFEKSQINRTISRYFKSKSIEKEEARKLAIIKTEESIIKSTLSTDTLNKSDYFSKLISIIDTNRQLHESDLSINQSLFKIKDACQKIGVFNQSSAVFIPHQSYNQRLRSCKNEYDNVITTIQKYKQRKLLDRNVNMAHLYLLMAQNQFRLGLIQNSQDFLKQSNHCLAKALKVEQKNKEVTLRINKQKLLLGNATKIGCLRLQSYIVAFFGKKQKKKQLLENLRKAKSTMFQKMNQPLHEADINESIGMVSSNLLLIYREIGFSDVRDPFLQAIKIRQNLLGPYNKYNARDYTLLVQMMSVPDVKNKYSKDIDIYYKRARLIYDRIDCSADSMLLLYRMQLQSTYYIFSLKQEQACKTIQYYLKCFDQCQNKQISLEIASQLYRSSWYLSQQQGYEKQGLKQLKKSYSYIDDLQKYVNKTYNLEKKDRRKKALSKLKVQNLRKIVEVQKLLKDKEYNIYLQLLNQEEQKLSKSGSVK